MREITSLMRRALVAGVLALAMAVGLASVGIGSATAADDGGKVVGKSDVGTITSKVVGKTSTGDAVSGSFTPIKVVERDGALYMKGFLQGVIADAGPDTKFSGLQTLPIKKINGQAPTAARVAAGAAACDILNLVLGPLDLNILGLQISLNRVVLDVVAVAGAGNLLGNLLCAVAGLLDGGLLGNLLGQLRGLLNQILAALNLGL
ncbi:MAG: transporter substrate-binding protein [Nocardioides sp.]|jgi:hypothetical protein|uniref:hypothetical protein n=1 Tax=Nocardioides sp. TaxID=35761 RepID=UPI002606E343|nr:hypothetical protein [Nocardioides sp.]MCW2835411.1 transporter substrate-binding protein [Nocardioides sp.]